MGEADLVRVALQSRAVETSQGLFSAALPHAGLLTDRASQVFLFIFACIQSLIHLQFTETLRTY